MAIDPNKYKHPNPNNAGLYAFAEVPVSILDVPIPDGVEYGTVEEGGVVRAKVVREFLNQFVMSLDGTKAILFLSAKQSEGGRVRTLDESDLNDWELYLSQIPIPESAWLTIDQYWAKLATEEYYNE